MDTVSTKVPEDVAKKFDRIVLVKRLRGEDTSKSEVLRELLEEWIEENEDVLEEVDT